MKERQENEKVKKELEIAIKITRDAKIITEEITEKEVLDEFIEKAKEINKIISDYVKKYNIEIDKNLQDADILFGKKSKDKPPLDDIEEYINIEDYNPKAAYDPRVDKIIIGLHRYLRFYYIPRLYIKLIIILIHELLHKNSFKEVVRNKEKININDIKYANIEDENFTVNNIGIAHRKKIDNEDYLMFYYLNEVITDYITEKIYNLLSKKDESISSQTTEQPFKKMYESGYNEIKESFDIIIESLNIEKEKVYNALEKWYFTGNNEEFKNIIGEEVFEKVGYLFSSNRLYGGIMDYTKMQEINNFINKITSNK